jgi:hypothetical protein
LGVQTKAEYGLRKSIFNETHTRIKKHNSKKGATYQLTHNSFSVLVIEYLSCFFLGVIQSFAWNDDRNILTIFGFVFIYKTDEEKQSYMGAFKPVRPNGIRGVSSRVLPSTVS